MEKILVKGVEVQFNDLTEEMQEKLYLERKAEFEKEATKSQYAKIRRLIINEDEIDPIVLDEVFNLEAEIYGNRENLNLIWKHPKFEKNDDKRKILAESDDWEIRMIPAEDEESSSEFLNQILRDKIQGDEDGEVIEAIINNPNFKMDEKTREMLAKSDDRYYRIMAADDEGSSSEFLNQMLQNEIQGYGDSKVIETIVNNPNFKMDEKTREMLAESGEWRIRMIPAKYEGSSSEFLNQMLRDEIQDYGDCDVIETIINNPNFKMEEEIRKMLAESNDYENRIIAAKYEGSSKEFLENMFLKEKSEAVLEAIEFNLLSKISKKSVTLNVVQERKIFNVLRNVKKDKKKQPLAEYVKEIVDIIS